MLTQTAAYSNQILPNVTQIEHPLEFFKALHMPVAVCRLPATEHFIKGTSVAPDSSEKFSSYIRRTEPYGVSGLGVGFAKMKD
jgi:hypothetical protein